MLALDFPRLFICDTFTFSLHDRKCNGLMTQRPFCKLHFSRVRVNACVTRPRVLGVSNFNVAEPSCKGMVMGWETRGKRKTARRRRERKVPEPATSVACPEICYGIMSGKLQRSQYRPDPGQSASVTYFATALTADCRAFVIIRFKCKSANLPAEIAR